MHERSLASWQHGHVFLGAAHGRHERRTWLVVALTAVAMVAEIVAGALYGSMALTADGWHMSTHAAALAIAALAYRFARTHADDPRFSFGTGKLGELAAFASAIILALIALLIGYESAVRLLAPVPIRFDEAMLVAVLGLAVNLLSAWLLWEGTRAIETRRTPSRRPRPSASSPAPRPWSGQQSSGRRSCTCRRCADLGAGDRRPARRPLLRVDVARCRHRHRRRRRSSPGGRTD